MPTGSAVTEKGGPFTQQAGLQVSTIAAAHTLHPGRRSTGATTRIRSRSRLSTVHLVTFKQAHVMTKPIIADSN